MQPDSNGKKFAEAGAFQDSKFTFDKGPDSSSVLFGAKFMECALYQLSPPEVYSSVLNLSIDFAHAISIVWTLSSYLLYGPHQLEKIDNE